MDDELIIALIFIGMFIFWINFKPSKKQETALKDKPSSNRNIVAFVLDLQSISRLKFINKYAYEDTIEVVEEKFPILNKRTMRKIIKYRNQIIKKETDTDKVSTLISDEELYWVVSSLPRDSVSEMLFLMPIKWRLEKNSEENNIEYLQTKEPFHLVSQLFHLEGQEKNIYLDLLYKAFEDDFILMFKEVASTLKAANHLRKTLNAYEKNLN
tara:strand:- start:619 stop:1254 length:636 start_codon:yes stop_codon:yes gene_type:complete